MKATKNKKDILDQLILNTELNLIKDDCAYAKATLEEGGFNLDAEAEFAKKQINKLKFLANAIEKKNREQNLLEQAYIKLKSAINNAADKSVETWVSLLREKAPSVQFRKLESWTEEEIKAVLNDLDLVKLLEELSKEAD